MASRAFCASTHRCWGGATAEALCGTHKLSTNTSTSQQPQAIEPLGKKRQVVNDVLLCKPSCSTEMKGYALFGVQLETASTFLFQPPFVPFLFWASAHLCPKLRNFACMHGKVFFLFFCDATDQRAATSPLVPRIICEYHPPFRTLRHPTTRIQTQPTHNNCC